MASPTGCWRTATLWPAGRGAVALTFGATGLPGVRVVRAITTPSSGLSAITRGCAIVGSPINKGRVRMRSRPCFSSGRRVRSGDALGSLAGLGNRLFGVGGHHAAVVHQRHPTEPHADGGRGRGGGPGGDTCKPVALC